MAAERRAQIVGAFITQIAQRGLGHVTLDDVAAAAGVSRSALNHFVGNRNDLIVATAEELCSRYLTSMRKMIGDQAGIEAVVGVMFSTDWVWGLSDENVAFDALLDDASRNPRTRAILKATYDELFDTLTAALRRSHPDAPAVAIRDTAYAIVCLSEYNVDLQKLGYPRARNRGAKQAALTLTAALDAPGRLRSPLSGLN